MENADVCVEEFTPRAYQVDLYEKAVAENTIIYLPTGSGKTFIAVMLIKKHSVDVQLPYSQGGKRIVFIVNTVPLVSQQSNYIARHTGLSCRGYSGDMAVDYWSQSTWLLELEEAQVLVMVGDIFLSLLNHGYMGLDKVSLIIFDECHKAVGSHPMRSIMQAFERCDRSKHPRVLGLTATLLNCNVRVEKIESIVRELEITFHAKVATVNTAVSVKNYGNCKESITYYDASALYGIEDQLTKLMDYMIQVLGRVKLKGTFDENGSSKELAPKPKSTKLKCIVEDIRDHIQTAGLYVGSKAVLMHMIQLECLKKFSDDVVTIGIIEFLVLQLTKMRKLIIDKMDGISEIEQIRKYSSDRILRLFTLLAHFHENIESDQKFCCIIFVRRRSTSQVLYHLLKRLRDLDERFKFIIPDFIVGYANNPYKNPRETLCLAKWNKEALRKFRSGQTNCIVATDVIDEGVDIPTCTLIVRYDLPNDFRGYIQSKGRARHANSLYAMLCARNDVKFSGIYNNYRKVESFLKLALIGRTDERDSVSIDEIEENLYKTEIKPYVVVNQYGVETAVTGLSAISLINRYCSNFVRSKFTHIVPKWTLHKLNDGPEIVFKVSLDLPSMSPLRQTIDGDVMSSIRLAKQSAALNTCKKLHQIGELSDRLLPLDSSAILASTDNLFPYWENETKDDATGIPGTTSKKRTHKITYPEIFHSAFPAPNQTLYLHVLEAKPAYPKPFESRQSVFYELLNDDASFGIITPKPMPSIPQFPVFMNIGDLNVNVKSNYKKFTLSGVEIAQLRAFHWILFNNVLRVIKNFMIFDKENLDNSFLVVPTDANGQINWAVIHKYKTVEEIPPTEDQHFYDYELALITPNYRTIANVYVVTAVCDDIMAESSFPTEDYYSYVHYYKERHGLVIKDGKQPMLEVKAISTRINCIKPRGLKANLSKRKRSDILEDFQEHLVGELCNKIEFPALYWLKGTYLPSVLHRISQLLVAEDLRIQIVNEARLGTIKLKNGRTWPPLIIPKIDNDERPDALLEISNWSTDDTFAESFPAQLNISGPEIDTLGMDVKLYPWKTEEEPVNVFKDIEKIQLIDIEYYHHFMSTPMATNDEILMQQNRSRQFMSRSSMKAPPLQIFEKNEPDGPSPTLIMQALTSKMAHDVFDLERLETLGDSLLKFAVSLYLFEAFPQFGEGQLTVIKGRLLGNRNLYYCGKNKRIPGRMKVDEFVPMSTFIPPTFTALRPLQELLIQNEISPSVLYELNIPPEEQLTGSISATTLNIIENRVLNWTETNLQSGMDHFLDIQIVPDKSVSDSVEALIGVYLNSMGLTGAFSILIWLGILPKTLVIKEILSSITASPRIGAGNPDDHIYRADYIEKQIGYRFKDRAYLLQAFTHASYTPNNITASYERLEFLGDAILDLVITVHIFESCGDLSPGALTDLRSALVNNITFACLAVKYGFHTALMSYSPKLQEVIERFVKFQEERDHAVDDELLWVLLEEEECNMAEYVDVPKILGDIFESVVGAIYLDTGKNLHKVWEIVYGLMHKEIAKFSKNVPKQPVRVIHETPGAQPRFSKATTIEGTGSAMVCLSVVISGKTKVFHGFGANKKQAKCAAAKQALKCLRRKD